MTDRKQRKVDVAQFEYLTLFLKQRETLIESGAVAKDAALKTAHDIATKRSDLARHAVAVYESGQRIL